MLKLTDIVKTYPSGEVTALHGVSVAFRQNEFVSILGPSGCGKTTLLNIIGGLDRYTSGELCVRHVPTAQFSERDWDAYRNHSVGFVFQSYNLIPHQSVLANVELALTLSGVSKAERRHRAEEALRAVGLESQMKKKPSQMSGGQMQRVAIARALVNDPDILLADEPTGALDSETSVQVMDILQKVAADRLVIMVTHNPDLAKAYSTRIIRVLDGQILEDTNPYDPAEEEKEVYAADDADGTAGEAAMAKNDEKVRGKKKTSMSFPTALSLSLNNLMTKKARTFLTAFAGSIGIIGIALILALSHGINLYIAKVQQDTLSAYPVRIDQESVDMSSLMMTMADAQKAMLDTTPTEEDGRVHANIMMFDMMDTMMSVDVQANNLSRFIDYVQDNGGDFDGYASAISYGYDLPLHVYSVYDTNGDGMPQRLNPSELFDDMMESMTALYPPNMPGAKMMTDNLEVWQETIGDEALMHRQYDLLAGKWPEAWNEVVLILDERSGVNDVYLYALGLKDAGEFEAMMDAAMNGEPFNAREESWTYDELLGHEFALVLPQDTYQKTESGWEYAGDNPVFMQAAVQNSEKLVISGIIRPDPEAAAASLTGAIGYLPALSEHILEETSRGELLLSQMEDPRTDLLSGLPFPDESNDPDALPASDKAARITEELAALSPADRAAAYTKAVSALPEEQALAQAAEELAVMPPEAVASMVQQAVMAEGGLSEERAAAYLATLPADEQQAMAMQILTAQIQQTYAANMANQLGSMTTDALSASLDTLLASLSPEQIVGSFGSYMPALVSDRTYEQNIAAFGYVDAEKPTYMKVYADTFESKEEIARIIREYNTACTEDGREADVIHYTDYVALMMSSVSTILDVISYVLIAFVSISLVVSSIMIGIITYISVLERTKEIGILRAVGASRRDISRVFNAETLLIGFTSGGLGILCTLLLCLPANLIIQHLTDISRLARLPLAGALILILISMTLTMVAGLIPSRIAARKDPVEALRNE